MSPHSKRPHSLYYLTINYSQQEYLKLELPNHRWMYATKALPPSAQEDESEDGEVCEVRSHGPVCVRDPETDEVSRESL